MEIETSLESLEIDGIDFLSHLKPVSPNLFTVSNLVEDTSEGLAALDPSSGSTNESTDPSEHFGTHLNSAKFRVSKIQLPGLKLQWNEIGAGQRYPTLAGISLSTEARITWVEDAFKTMDHFHRTWMNAWYSRETGRFKVGVKGKFKTLEVYIYDYFLEEENDFENIKPKPRMLYRILLKGLAPTDLKDIVYGYNEEGEQTVEYQYKIFSAQIFTVKNTEGGFGLQGISDDEEHLKKNFSKATDKSYYYI